MQHVAADIDAVITGIRQPVAVAAQYAGKNQGTQIFAHFISENINAKFFGIQYINFSAVLTQEFYGTLIHRSLSAGTQQNEERRLLIRYFKRTVEKFTGVDGVGMYPLAFHQYTGSRRIP